MYVAVKGGESAILASYDLLAQERRGDPAVAELSIEQICQQLRLGVDRVMTEGSVYDPQLAALAITLAIVGGWQLATLVDYTRALFQRIPTLFA